VTDRSRIRRGREVFYTPTAAEETAGGDGPWPGLIVRVNSDGSADLVVDPPTEATIGAALADPLIAAADPTAIGAADPTAIGAADPTAITGADPTAITGADPAAITEPAADTTTGVVNGGIVGAPTTPSSQLGEPGGFSDWNVNISEAVVFVQGVIDTVPAEVDFDVASGVEVCNDGESVTGYVVAKEAGGVITFDKVLGAAAATGAEVPPNDAAIDAAVTHNRWVKVARVTFNRTGDLTCTQAESLTAANRVAYGTAAALANDLRLRAAEYRTLVLDIKARLAEYRTLVLDEKSRFAEYRTLVLDLKSRQAENRTELVDLKARTAQERTSLVEIKADLITTAQRLNQIRLRTSDRIKTSVALGGGRGQFSLDAGPSAV